MARKNLRWTSSIDYNYSSSTRNWIHVTPSTGEGNTNVTINADRTEELNNPDSAGTVTFICSDCSPQQTKTVTVTRCMPTSCGSSNTTYQYGHVYTDDVIRPAEGCETAMTVSLPYSATTIYQYCPAVTRTGTTAVTCTFSKYTESGQRLLTFFYPENKPDGFGIIEFYQSGATRYEKYSNVREEVPWNQIEGYVSILHTTVTDYYGSNCSNESGQTVGSSVSYSSIIWDSPLAPNESTTEPKENIGYYPNKLSPNSSKITLIQQPRVVECDCNSISFTPQANIPCEGTSHSRLIKINSGYCISSITVSAATDDKDWITSVNVNSEGYILGRVERNDSDDPRTGHIIVRYIVDGEFCENKTATFTQDGGCVAIPCTCDTIELVGISFDYQEHQKTQLANYSINPSSCSTHVKITGASVGEDDSSWITNVHYDNVNDKIVGTIAEYTSTGLLPRPRTGTVYVDVSVYDEPYYACKSFTVVQAAPPACSCNLAITGNEFNGHSGETLTIGNITSTAYECLTMKFSSSEDWLSNIKLGGIRGTVVGKATANVTGAKRTATVTVKYKKANDEACDDYTFTVSQKTLTCNCTNCVTFEQLSPVSCAEGFYQFFKINSADCVTDITVSVADEDNDWITSVDLNTQGYVQGRIKRNIGDSQRTGHINVVCKIDGQVCENKVATFTQNGGCEGCTCNSVNLVGQSLSYEAQTGVTLATYFIPEYCTGQLSVTTATSNSDWIERVTVSDGVIYGTVTANDSWLREREGSISVTCTFNGTTCDVVNVPVIQAEAPTPECPCESLEISACTEVVGDDSSSATIGKITNGTCLTISDFSVVSGANWINNVSLSTNSQGERIMIIADVSANTTNSARTATISVNYKSGVNTCESKQFEIKQLPRKCYDLNVTNTTGSICNGNTLTVTFGFGNETICT